MTTQVYNKARYLFATAQIDWLTASVHATLLNGAYAPAPGDTYLSDVPAGAIMQDVPVLAPGVTPAGVCYCTIPQFNAFTSASTVVAVMLYLYTGNPATSTLIYYSSDGVGFPFQPEGFNYSVGYDQAAGGYFQA